MNPIRTERDGGILCVTLDRPKANAINLETSRLMGETFAGFRDDPELRVAIIKTAGDRFFSAGWDLKAAADGDAEHHVHDHQDQGTQAVERLPTAEQGQGQEQQQVEGQGQEQQLEQRLDRVLVNPTVEKAVVTWADRVVASEAFARFGQRLGMALDDPNLQAELFERSDELTSARLVDATE